MESSNGAAPGGSRSPQLALAGLPDNALDILAARLGGQSRLSLSHTCCSLRQAGQRWFARVWVRLSPELDCACLASWLRRHKGVRACLVLEEDSDASLLDKLTSDSSELRGLAVCNLMLHSGPEVDTSQLRNLDQLTSLVIENRRLTGRTDSLGQLTALQRLELSRCLETVPSALAALTGLTRLALADVRFSVDNQTRILPQLAGLCSLELLNCGLAAVPTAVTALTALTDLDLSWNRLGQPAGLTLLAALAQLHALSLGGNDCDIPEGLSALTGLTALRLYATRPSHPSMERMLPRLGSLQCLVLANCRLASMPTAITALTALTHLDLHGNRWDDAEGLAPVAALTRLRKLELSNSNCGAPGSLSTLTALTELRLDKYPLRLLPPVVSALTRLEVLSLRRAKVKRGWRHLRPLTRLRELDLGGCDLKQLPQELTALQALETLRMVNSYPAHGWQHLLALPRLRWLHTSVEPPAAVATHVHVIPYFEWEKTDSESELSDPSSDSDA